MPGIAADEDSAHDRRRAVAVLDVVDRSVERVRPPVLGQRQLHGLRVLSRFVREMPTRVIPRARISGVAVARRVRAASRIVCD